MEKENIYNIPNLLSFYRMVTFPVILYLVFAGNEKWFSILLCVNFITDILDGLIARAFKLQTKLGARLDSLADIGTYILAICGVFTFKWHDISPFRMWFLVFLGAYIFSCLVSVVKFHKFPSLHLYSCKIGGYIQGIFFFVLFFSRFYPWLFVIATGWGILSYLEETIALLLLPEMKSDCKGLFWVIRNKRETHKMLTKTF